MPTCQFCKQQYSTAGDMRRHQQQSPTCKSRSSKNFAAFLARRKSKATSSKEAAVPDLPAHELLADPMIVDGGNGGELDTEASGQSIVDDCDAMPPRIAQVPVIDSSRQYWRRDSPADRLAGASGGSSKTPFQRIRDDQILKGAEILGPFKDDDEWELAKWLIKNVGHNQAEAFLKLPIITNRAKPAYGTKTEFLDAVDALPAGVKWSCEEMTITGDVPDLKKDPSGGTYRTETLDLWYRDPVECVAELMGNPAFKEAMRYAPEQIYADANGEVEVINEMWTGSWWRQIQARLPKGATLAPLIIASDKTLLSNFRGDNSAWPVYLTIGNIAKDVRRQVSSHATVLLGYLPIPKFDCFSDSTRSAHKYRLFHACMGIIMSSLQAAGKAGKEMVCADGLLRHVYPIIAAYIADYPEQCLIACCKENRCPICPIDPKERGSHLTVPKRDPAQTLEYLREPSHPQFTAQGLRHVYPPFWANLPHSDIFQSFTPDLLHQLHKGVFKDHLVKWCSAIISESEVDARFRDMPTHNGLRHFKHGISHVSQWTGTEHKEMEKIFLGLVTQNAPQGVIRAVRGLVDFIHYASLQSHTSHTLLAMRHALNEFHSHKNIFIELGGRTQPHFNIPKIHSLEHYEDLIRLFGSADGFNTESPERLHIDYAKNAYRASNRKDYIQQMVRWLDRQEAVDRFSAYLEWARPLCTPLSSTPGPHVLGTPFSNPPSQQQNTEAGRLPQRLPLGSIAREPPLRNIPVEHIMSANGHGAVRFLDAMTAYLVANRSRFVPQQYDLLNTWQQISFRLPNIPEVGHRHSNNIVQAIGGPFHSPTSGSRRIADSEQAQMDFALVTTGEANSFTAGTALDGLRVAQVRVIFQLPTQAGLGKRPLAYIEWMTPLRHPDPVHGYHRISRSTRQKRGIDGPYAEVVPVDRLVRSAMLIPQTRGSSTTFLLNSHIDRHSFCMIKLDARDSLPH
ncbi:hypothetical protein HGRIS_008482 [Hohenbuehelia grisea]|uniref:C2H2-type domain-containing protein n=1 Tax=Hohenbuehelia grisea TaxID=104357 RepID=A0ABR3J831_9AGAR